MEDWSMINFEVVFLKAFPVCEGEGIFNYCGSTMSVIAGGLLWSL